MKHCSAITCCLLLMLLFSECLTPKVSASAQISVDKSSETIRKNVNSIHLFTLLETEPDKLEESAGAILKSNPGDRAALTALAWYYLRKDRFVEAFRYFSELNRIDPDQIDHVTGMIYALSGMENINKVMELAPEVNSFFYKVSPGS